MKIFQAYQEFITFMIVRDDWRETPYESSRGLERFERFQERFQSIKNFLLCNMMTSGCFFLLMFFYLEANTFQEYSDTCYAFTSLIFIAYILKHFEWNQEKIFTFFDNLEIIVNKRLPNPRSRVIYEEANAYVEKWTKLISFAFMKVTLPSLTIPYFVVSCYLYFIVDLEKDSFYLPFPIWIPLFEWRNPPMYFALYMQEFLIAYYGEKMCASLLPFAVGVCRFMDAFGEDIKSDVYDLNDRNLVKGNPVELYKKFCKVIEFHSTVKQFAPAFSDIFNIIYTMYFLWTPVTMCDILLLIDIELMSNSHNIMTLIKLPMTACWSFVSIFWYCDSSERLSTRFGEIDFYYICDWYLFPKKIQRSLPIVIMNTQTVVVLEGFGNVPCTRETFKNVTNAGVSYFMIIRQFL